MSFIVNSDEKTSGPSVDEPKSLASQTHSWGVNDGQVFLDVFRQQSEE